MQIDRRSSSLRGAHSIESSSSTGTVVLLLPGHSFDTSQHLQCIHARCMSTACGLSRQPQ
eukprot:15299-Heterococcus_DN1.PRE.1